MSKNTIKTWILATSLLFWGCESWLNVQPIDKISEEQIFSTPQGFRNALNGVYIDLNSSDTYGGTMMATALDVMAQCYVVGKDHNLEKTATYTWNQEQPKKMFQSAWNGMYKLIGNVNLFLSNIQGDAGGVLSLEERDLLTGEALALRGMLHFDLFRLFGPVYLTDSTALALPYYENYNGVSQAILTGTDFKDWIIRDLNAAEQLLVNDPVIKFGTMMAPGEREEVVNRYRGLRLNYYALLALQARVALYVNQPSRALAYAQNALRDADRHFPFMDYRKWVFEPENPDRILSSECLFALQNTKRNTIFRNSFEATLAAEKRLSPHTGLLEGLYDPMDYRLRSWWERVEKEIDNGDGPVEIVNYSLLKYKDVKKTAELFNSMLPMIRRSEMHYIIAELQLQGNMVEQARLQLDAVRYTRGLSPYPAHITAADLETEITREYQREFYGEGQLFFYYKRKNFSQIPGSTIQMNAEKYVVPLPESETQHRD